MRWNSYVHFLFRHRVAQPCRRPRCVQCKRKLRLAADGLRDEDLHLLPDTLRMQQTERRAANAKTEQKQSAREAILRRWEEQVCACARVLHFLFSHSLCHTELINSRGEQDATASKHPESAGGTHAGADDDEEEEMDFDSLMAKMKLELAGKALAAAPTD